VSDLAGVRGGADAEWLATLRFRSRGASTVLLVEGVSDVAAIDALAARMGSDLATCGTIVVAMGGATNIRRYLGAVAGLGLRAGGLVDAAEARYFGDALGLRVEQLGDSGYFVCHPDLEGELVRALGTERAIGVIRAAGDLKLWEIFSNQPFQRERSTDARLHRFFGTTSGRKEKYGKALVNALDLASAPLPLAELLRFATTTA
jgi:hypothetical protein